MRSGAIGRLVQTVGLAPHRLNRALRPSWFFDKPAYGGIINDIGVHPIDQFLAFADAEDAEIVSSTIGAFGTEPDRVRGFRRSSCWPRHRCVATSGSTGSRRRPADLGRRAVVRVGTEGTLELRKNLDIAGREGEDHMFVVNRTATRYIDCSKLPVTYYRDFLRDIADRTETAMPQRQTFTVCRLALQAQAQAARFTARRA